MELNKKTWGVLLIIIGIALISVGVWTCLPRTTTNNPGIYSEQNGGNMLDENVNTNTNNSIYTEPINVYSEDTEEGATRYIY